MSAPERCLYTLVHAPREHHDVLLRELVGPLAGEIRGHPCLQSLFFARYDTPDWQLRFRILGSPEWVDGPVRDAVSKRLPPLRDRGLLTAWEFATYQREWERYGGPVGMPLCEQLFLHDSLACLELLDAEARGGLGRSRREYCLSHTERFLGVLHLDRSQRMEVYRNGFRWAVDGGDWSERDRALAEERYLGLRDGLAAFLAFPEEDTAAGISRRCLAASRPAVAALRTALAAGQVMQDPVHLAWSLTHMHCNRIGLDVHAEAVMRYFMFRLHEDAAIPLGYADGPE